MVAHVGGAKQLVEQGVADKVALQCLVLQRPDHQRGNAPQNDGRHKDQDGEERRKVQHAGADAAGYASDGERAVEEGTKRPEAQHRDTPEK